MNHLQGWLCLGLTMFSTGALHGFVAESHRESAAGLLKNLSSVNVDAKVLRVLTESDKTFNEIDGFQPTFLLRDKVSGAIRLMHGTFSDMPVIKTRNSDAFVQAAKDYVDRHSEIFDLNSKDLRVLPSALLMGQDEQFVKFHVYRDGLRIKDAAVDFRFKFGKLLQISNQSFAEAKVRSGAELSNTFQLAEQQVNGELSSRDAVYRVVEKNHSYALEKVQTFEVRDEHNRTYTLEIDAQTGKVRELNPHTYFYSGQAQADAYTRWFDENLEAKALSFLDLQSSGGSLRTDEQGTFSADENAAPRTGDGLNGQYVRVHDMGGQNVQATGSLQGNTWMVHVKHEGSEDRWMDKRIAQNMIYAKTNAIIRYAKTFISNPWLNEPLVANANLYSTCNAHWDGQTINLYSGGSGCANTGLIADVMYHEWGHGLHQNSGGIQDGALSEGFGDILSLVMTHSHLLGVGFRIPSREPVRDLTVKFSYPQDRGEVHSEGRIIGSTFWDLFVALKEKYGEEVAGTMLANYAFKMIFTSRTYLDVYNALLVIDSNGTDPSQHSPNYCTLNEVFSAHGLIESDVACKIASIPSWEIDGNSSNIFRPGTSSEIRFNAHNAGANDLVGLKGVFGVRGLDGAVVEQADLSWDTIANNATVLSRDAARLQIPSTAKCGQTFTANIHLRADTRELTLSKEFVLGRSEGQPESFASVNLPQRIYDNSTTTASVDTSAKNWGAETQANTVKVAFNINHTYLYDLTVSLRAPDGTTMQIYKGTRRGNGGLNFEADVTEQFKTKKISGEWQLIVTDHNTMDEGTLNSFSLNITPAIYSCN